MPTATTAPVELTLNCDVDPTAKSWVGFVVPIPTFPVPSTKSPVVDFGERKIDPVVALPSVSVCIDVVPMVGVVVKVKAPLMDADPVVVIFAIFVRFPLVSILVTEFVCNPVTVEFMAPAAVMVPDVNERFFPEAIVVSPFKEIAPVPVPKVLAPV